MDLFVNGMERWDWLLPAICDLLALASVAGVVRLMMPVASKPPLRQASDTSAETKTPNRILPDQEARSRKDSPRSEPAARADVSRALEAIGRWERHHGSSRGITELARWVEGQKKEREAVSAR